jgi:hypothetical protein
MTVEQATRAMRAAEVADQRERARLARLSVRAQAKVSRILERELRALPETSTGR